MAEIAIRRAELGDTELVAPLFDLYRQFYEKPADPALATHFIADRLRNAVAQALYQSRDWVRNEMFHSYVKTFSA